MVAVDRHDAVRYLPHVIEGFASRNSVINRFGSLAEIMNWCWTAKYASHRPEGFEVHPRHLEIRRPSMSISRAASGDIEPLRTVEGPSGVS
jgi:hypothetical protein